VALASPNKVQLKQYILVFSSCSIALGSVALASPRFKISDIFLLEGTAEAVHP